MEREFLTQPCAATLMPVKQLGEQNGGVVGWSESQEGLTSEVRKVAPGAGNVSGALDLH